MGKKSTMATVRERVERIYALRLGGAEFHDIRQFAAAPEQNWQVSDRQLFRYVAAADKLMKERFDAKAEHLLARHLLQRRTLFARAVEAGDYGNALRCLDSEARLEGLEPPKKIAPVTPDGSAAYAPTVTLSDADLAAAVAAVFAAVGAGNAGALGNEAPPAG